jgi:hypothetical protein
MLARAEVQCDTLDENLKMTIENLAKKNNGEVYPNISHTVIIVDFMDNLDAEAFKKQGEESGLTVSVIQL